MSKSKAVKFQTFEELKKVRQASQALHAVCGNKRYDDARPEVWAKEESEGACKGYTLRMSAETVDVFRNSIRKIYGCMAQSAGKVYSQELVGFFAYSAEKLTTEEKDFALSNAGKAWSLNEHLKDEANNTFDNIVKLYGDEMIRLGEFVLSHKATRFCASNLKVKKIAMADTIGDIEKVVKACKEAKQQATK